MHSNIPGIRDSTYELGTEDILAPLVLEAYKKAMLNTEISVGQTLRVPHIDDLNLAQNTYQVYYTWYTGTW